MEDNVIENHKYNESNVVKFVIALAERNTSYMFYVKVIFETEHGVLLDELFKDKSLNKIKNRIFNFMDKHEFLKLVSVCRPEYESCFERDYKSDVGLDVWTYFSNEVKKGKRKRKRRKTMKY